MLFCSCNASDIPVLFFGGGCRGAGVGGREEVRSGRSEVGTIPTSAKHSPHSNFLHPLFVPLFSPLCALCVSVVLSLFFATRLLFFFFGADFHPFNFNPLAKRFKGLAQQLLKFLIIRDGDKCAAKHRFGTGCIPGQK